MRKCAYLFPGQASQKVGMGRDFFDSESRARELFAEADETLGYSLSRLCFEGPEEDLTLTKNAQPALLTVSYAAFCLLGKDPLIAAGHSLGEYSALVSSGCLCFADAVRLVHNRGLYMQEAVPVGEGAMAAVMGADEETVTAALSTVTSGVVTVANRNSSEQIVIAGHKRAVEEAMERIDAPRVVLLPVSAPFHCELMKSAEEKLAYDLNHVEFRDPRFPVVSNVDARIMLKGSEARDALRRQVSRSVRWYESMEVLRKEGIGLTVELGAGQVLSGLMKRITRRWESRPEIMNIEDVAGLERARAALSA